MATLKRILASAAIAVLGAALLMTTGATTAVAEARNGVCEDGEICFYYLDDRGGSLSDFTTSVANYGTTQPTCYEFRTPGALGYQQCMKNNARSAWNRSSTHVTVYFNSNYGKPCDLIGPDRVLNLEETYDENASHRFIASSCPY